MNNVNFEQFKQLHHQSTPLILNNVWDTGSACIVQEHGANALATSSASLAWSLGYADGSQLPLNELLMAIERIQNVAKVPLSVDIESGYSDSPQKVADLCKALVEIGVAGINIEDGSQAPDLLIAKIDAIATCTKGALFINARTDVFLRSLTVERAALNMTIERLIKYLRCGAHGGFVPGLNNATMVSEIVSSVNMPINLMVENLQTALAYFSDINVARFSIGPNSYLSAYQHLLPKGSTLSYDKMNGYFMK